MPPTTATTTIIPSAAERGRRQRAVPGRLRPPVPLAGLRRRGRAGAEVAAGVALLAAWALLWSVLVAGVLAPAGRMAHAADGAHPGSVVQAAGPGR